jgi:hypothetical protein
VSYLLYPYPGLLAIACIVGVRSIIGLAYERRTGFRKWLSVVGAIFPIFLLVNYALVRMLTNVDTGSDMRMGSDAVAVAGSLSVGIALAVYFKRRL